MKKAHISIEWLYLFLFILTVAFLLIAVVPDEAWPPSIKERFIEKVDIKNFKIPHFIKDPNDCTKLNEKECTADVKKGCFPTYTSRRSIFLDCIYCPEHPRCAVIKEEKACNNSPCELSCKWVKEKTSISGKCINDNIEKS
jgi:hypothetical protein